MEVKPARNVMVSQSVRPIRFAFLVPLKSKSHLLEVMRLNCCLWGGMFNFIIPVFTRTPDWWSEFRPDRNGHKIIDGYLKSFEPDFLVKPNDFDSSKLNFDPKRILNFEKLMQNDDFEVGLSTYPVYRKLWETEFKFVQREPRKAAWPIAKGSLELFCASVFGDFPKAPDHYGLNYQEIFQAERIKLTDEKLAEFFVHRPLMPIDVSAKWAVFRSRPSRDDRTFFVMEPNSIIDAIDYWNLRAVGCSLLPITIEWASKLATSVKSIADYVEKNGHKRGQPSRIGFLRGRGISKSVFHSTVDSILSGSDIRHVRQDWFPRMWDVQAATWDQVRKGEVSHSDENHTLPIENGQISIPPQCPKFLDDDFFAMKSAWANVLKLSSYGTDPDHAFVFPAGLKDFEKILETHSTSEVFSTSGGIVMLDCNMKVSRSLTLPTGTALLKSWLNDLGLKSDLSGAGKTAKELIRSLGGPGEVRLIRNIKMIELLNEMANGLVVDSEEGQPDDGTRSRYATHGRWWALLMEQHEKHKEIAKRHLDQLCSKGVLKLGLRINCSHCSQVNWFSLEQVNESLICERCLEKFRFPVARPPQSNDWSYRTQGAFSSAGYANGAYSVALAIRFFSHGLRKPCTWSPNLDIKLKNGKKLEVDFLALIQDFALDGSSPQPLIVGECKTFDSFDKHDIARATHLSEAFPNAIFAFCTLKDDLEEQEKLLLKKLADKFRTRREKEGKGPRVMVLTATELSSTWPPPACWVNAGERFKEFSRPRRTDLMAFAETTCQIYLGTKQQTGATAQSTHWTTVV